MENANIFQRFFSELAKDVSDKLWKLPNKFTSQTTQNNYGKTSCNVSNDFELSSLSKEVIRKNLLSLNTSKAARIDGIPLKFQKDGEKVLAVPLRNIINYQ